MAAHEQLILDILANTTQAERGIGSLSRTIGAADDDVMGLAKRLDDLGRKSASARVKLEGNAEAQAQLDKLDAKMLMVGRRVMDPKIKVDGAARAAVELAGLDAAFDKVGKSAEKAAGTGGAAGGGLAALAGPQGMGALIGAGVALSPVLITVGTGLGGLAAAAYGVAKPIEAAAQKAGGLQANLQALDPLERQVAVGILGLGKQYDAFQKALKPEVIGIFNQGLRIAGHLMHDIEPVAAATGKAFGQVLGQVDKEFQSGTWQRFFGFMARTAAPDTRLLGNLFAGLLEDIPPIVMALQPLSAGILRVAGSLTQMISNLERGNTGLESFIKFTVEAGRTGAPQAAHSAGILGAALHFVENAGKAGSTALREWAFGSGKAATAADSATPKISAEAQATRNAARQFHQLVAAINTYVTNTSSMLAATNSVITDIRQMTKDSRAAGASFTGLNANSITLQNDLSQNLIPTVETVIHRMQGAGASSHDLAKVLSSDLKPAVDKGALANKDLRDEIFAMAREAGYAGPNKIAPLSRFIDRNAGSLRGARNDANSYTRALKGIPRDISTHIKLTAQAQIAVSTGVQRQIPGPRAARGMLITAGTTPTADDVLIRASKDELIVPANMVRAGEVDHLRGRIPGFASGGFAGSFSGSLPGLTKWIGSEDRAVAQVIASAVEKGVRSAMSAAVGALGGPTSASAAQAQAYARGRLGAYGWGASQMPPLIALWNQESGWNRFARNPSSGAYGIPQALPPGKMGAAANPPTSSAAAQINWGLGYIRGRYGSPAGAEAHENAFHWYDSGGWLPPGPSLAFNGTGRPERVGGGNTYNITVNVPPAANKADIGRETVKAIVEFEKRSGSGWRR